MNPRAIFSKTGKGVQEASGRTSHLSRADRAVLKEIDGKTVLGDVAGKFEKIPPDKFDALIQQLDKDGFIREVSSGVTEPAPPPRAAPPRPPAGKIAPPATPDDSGALDFTQALKVPPRPAASAAPKPPPVDIAAAAHAEAQRKAKEQEFDFKARQEAEARVKAEAAAKAKAEAEARARAAAAAAAEAKAKAEAEAKARAEAEARARADSEAKVKAAREAAMRLAAEAKAKTEAAERRAREEAEARAKAEAEMKARLEEERRAREEAERRAAEAAERARKELEEKAKREAEELRQRLEAEMRAKLEEEQRKREEEDRKRRQEEEARRAKEEAERRAREEEERKRREEEERKRREEEERRAKEEAERRAREDEERKRREKEDEERRAREEAERKRRDEEERRRREADDRQRREEDERRRREAEERRAKEEAERKSREEAAARAKEAEPAAAPGAAPAAAAGGGFGDLMADLDSFAQRDEEERKAKEEAERKAKEEAARRAREEEERRRREEEEEQRREEEARRAKAEAEQREREEAEQREREEAQAREREEAERKHKAKEEAERQAKEEAARRPAAAKVAAGGGDEVAVTDEDLDMEDVRRDEKALSKEARKREAERAEPVVAAKVRRPVKWGKPAAIALFAILAGGIGVLNVMPVSTAEYEKAASEALGAPVKIASARLSVLTGVEVRLEGVSIGEAVKIRLARGFPEVGSLFGAKKTFNRIELEGVALTQGQAGEAAFGKLAGDTLRARRIVLKQTKLEGPLTLPALDIDATIGGDGAVQSIVLSGPDKLLARLAPSGSEVAFEISAGSLALPFVPALQLQDFGMKGTASRQGVTAAEFDGRVYDGILKGTARMRWGASWSVEGNVSARNMKVAVFAPTLVSQGKVEAEGKYAMSGPNAAKLYAGARLEGSFKIENGVIGNFNLRRALETGGAQTGGSTEFAEMTGQGVYERGAVQLRNIAFSSGAMNAGASLDIDTGGALAGRIAADVKTPNQTLRAVLNISGRLQDPVVRK